MIRFATIGTNFIVDHVLQYIKEIPNLEYVSAYSRKEETGRAFAQKHGAKRFDTNLLALAEASDIDMVYIASPNSFHHHHAMMMLQHKKHVLCEKTIASNSKELEEMLISAKENNVILMEGMRTVFDPAFRFIEENLEKLGKIRKVSFQYCDYSSRYNDFRKGIIQNAFNPIFSNGALMDIGVYCIHPMVHLFGEPKKIFSDAIFLENGVDGAGTTLFSYEDMQGEMVFSKISNTKTPSQIQGEDGTMTIDRIDDPREIKIFYRDGKEEVFTFPKPEFNLQYEILEFVDCMEKGENPIKRNENSIITLRVLDEIRRQCGIVFPADER